VRRAQAPTGRVAAALFQGNSCNRSFEGLTSAAGVAAEAPGGVHLGKIGYVVFQLAEVAVPGKLFAALLGRIGRLRLASASG
jgi:hypothetical protein